MAFDSILVIDDELIVRKSLEDTLRRRRCRVRSVSTLREGEAAMSKGQYDMVFCDLGLPDGNGIDFLQRYSGNREGPIIVMITSHNSVETAVECMRLGAFDYVLKPFGANQVNVIIEKAEKFDQLVKVNQYYSKDENKRDFLGDAKPMVELKQLIERVARTDATVLVHGETGTGKELIAREIFHLSRRSDRPFIKVNCAAISETLIESEFFGHEKGAFTGAVQRRKGRFELADGGTLLLDEISEISLPLQGKLLRVLQEKEFERVGGQSTIKVDTRVIATTNRNLLKSVEKGEFRQDLYYRLNVFPLQAPPLRARRSDIPLLVNHFLTQFGRKHGIRPNGVAPDAMDLLLRHDWPGNVRELQNAIEHAVIMCSNGQPITTDCLAFAFSSDSRCPGMASPAPSRDDVPRSDEEAPPPANIASDTNEAYSLADIEREHIHKVLLRTAGNRTQAARILDVSVRTLRNKLAAYREAGHTEFSVFD